MQRFHDRLVDLLSHSGQKGAHLTTWQVLVAIANMLFRPRLIIRWGISEVYYTEEKEDNKAK